MYFTVCGVQTVKAHQDFKDNFFFCKISWSFFFTKQHHWQHRIEHVSFLLNNKMCFFFIFLFSYASESLHDRARNMNKAAAMKIQFECSDHCCVEINNR